ncbi:effector-associated constant component EACC1 [Frankia gtarii]|uniref:effector-associated constant component EACC1 n=1 Tax=Frankia gtarii TaxID=2950102 RepID=UPI0021BF7F24|nr:effector-associated domain EAD1-containing protein [Frankia gtarii]
MDVELAVDGDPSGDEARSLRRWLLETPEFRGRVSLRESPPDPAELGRRIDAVVLALGGAAENSAESLLEVLQGWLSSRRRTPAAVPFSLQLRLAPGEITASVSAELANGQLDESLRAFIDELTARLRSNAEVACPADVTRPPGEITDGPAGFAAHEVRELARVFNSAPRVDLLLRAAGLGPELFLAFESAPNVLAYWTDVGHQLALGRSPRGRSRILAMAADEFPANPVFRGAREVPPGPTG